MGLPTGRPFKKFVTRDGRESGYTTTLSVLPAVFLGAFFLSVLLWNDFFKAMFGADNLATFAFVFALLVTVLYRLAISPLLKKLEKEPTSTSTHDAAAKSKKVEERSLSRTRGKPRSYK